MAKFVNMLGLVSFESLPSFILQLPPIVCDAHITPDSKNDYPQASAHSHEDNSIYISNMNFISSICTPQQTLCASSFSFCLFVTLKTPPLYCCLANIILLLTFMCVCISSFSQIVLADHLKRGITKMSQYSASLPHVRELFCLMRWFNLKLTRLSLFSLSDYLCNWRGSHKKKQTTINIAPAARRGTLHVRGWCEPGFTLTSKQFKWKRLFQFL